VPIHRTNLKKLEALVAAGMPGAHRALVFLCIQKLYGPALLGSIASWFSIAQIIGFFTAIGWSSLLMVRVSKAKTKHERVQIFNSLLFMALFTLLICMVLATIIGCIADKQTDTRQICYWLTAWTLYQISRHYFIALKQYRRALTLDISIILTSIACLFISSLESLSTLLALSMIACSVVCVLVLQIGCTPAMPKFEFDSKGIQFGLSNFLGNGVALAFIPLAAHFEDKAFAGILSLFMSIAAITQLVPRAISLDQLPTISKSFASEKNIRIEINLMRGQILISNIAASLVCFIAAIFLTMDKPLEVSETYLMAIFSLTIAQTFLSVQTLVDANILMSKEQTRDLLLFNSINTCAFSGLTGILYTLKTPNSFLILLTLLTLLNAYRLTAIKKKAEKVL